jgi:hypothetical protein
MKRKTNHTFHLIATVLTFGAWVPIWLGMWVYNSARRPRPVVMQQPRYDPYQQQYHQYPYQQQYHQQYPHQYYQEYYQQCGGW